jgi:hypothetical protein
LDRSRFGVGVRLVPSVTDVTARRPATRRPCGFTLGSGDETHERCSVSLRNPPEAARLGSCIASFLLRDVPLPGSDVVARPDALRAAPGGARGVRLALRSVTPARRALDPRRIRWTHVPFPERRPDDFCRGIGCASLHGSDLSHPLMLSDSRSRTFAAASGFWPLAGKPFRLGFLRYPIRS